MMGFGFLVFLIFAGVAIFAAIGFGQMLLSKNSSFGSIFESGTKKLPIEILEERYAKGEISREEFEFMKNEIR